MELSIFDRPSFGIKVIDVLVFPTGPFGCVRKGGKDQPLQTLRLSGSGKDVLSLLQFVVVRPFKHGLAFLQF
jgi:hypothetical protein